MRPAPERHRGAVPGKQARILASIPRATASFSSVGPAPWISVRHLTENKIKFKKKIRTKNQKQRAVFYIAPPCLCRFHSHLIARNDSGSCCLHVMCSLAVCRVELRASAGTMWEGLVPAPGRCAVCGGEWSKGGPAFTWRHLLPCEQEARQGLKLTQSCFT